MYFSLPSIHRTDDIIGNEICIDKENDSLISFDPSKPFCDTATYDPLSIGYSPSIKYKVFLSYVQKEGTRAAMLFKIELEKMGHKCWLDLYAKDKSTSGMEEGVRKCDIFFPILTESYLTRKACLMELAWAMQYKKRVQPLHLPTDKDTIKRYSVPKSFNWIFSIDILPVQDSDSRLLRCTIPILLSDANQVNICPPLPDGMNAQEVVNEAMIEFDTNMNDYTLDNEINTIGENTSLASLDPSTIFSEAPSYGGDSPTYKLYLSYVHKEAKPAVMLFKTELEKVGHKCRLSMHNDRCSIGAEDNIRRCDVFFLVLTESYLSLETSFMEVAWAMKYGKKVQPLHLPSAKGEIGYWSSIAPQIFSWIFSINILPLENSDSRLLSGTVPVILSDACKAKTCPSLPVGMNVEETVKQAKIEVETKKSENKGFEHV